MTLKSSFSLVKISADPEKIVWIKDDNGLRSVTNDAERVCRVVNKAYPGHRIIYRDSDGQWDELKHKDGVFLDFVFLGERGKPV